MELRNQIKLTKRERQTGATREITAKFFGNKDSVLIVQNQLIKNSIIANHIDVHIGKVEELSARIVVFGRGTSPNDFEETIAPFGTWYLDVCTKEVTKIVMGLALDMDKTLIGHYSDEC